MSVLRGRDTVFRMDNNGRSLSYSLHLFNDAVRSYAHTLYFTALYIDILCMHLIELSNHEIINHNLIVYLNECVSCVLVYLCFGGRLCSFIE